MQPLQHLEKHFDRQWRPSLGGIPLAIWVAFMLVSCALPGGTTTASPTIRLPTDVPLPQSSTLAQQVHSPAVSGQTWIYTVPKTDARHIEAFYRTALPQLGWTNYQAVFNSSGRGESVSITAQRIGQTLTITAGPGQARTVKAPAGGVTLQLAEAPMGV